MSCMKSFCWSMTRGWQTLLGTLECITAEERWNMSWTDMLKSGALHLQKWGQDLI